MSCVHATSLKFACSLVSSCAMSMSRSLMSGTAQAANPPHVTGVHECRLLIASLALDKRMKKPNTDTMSDHRSHVGVPFQKLMSVQPCSVRGGGVESPLLKDDFNAQIAGGRHASRRAKAPAPQIGAAILNCGGVQRKLELPFGGIA